MAEAVSNKEALKRLGFARELVIYICLGVVPVFVAWILVLVWWSRLSLVALVCVAPLAAYATMRFGLFLGLKTGGWVVLLVLFLAGYLGSNAFLLYRGYRYAQEPPEPPPLRKAEDDPDYHPRGDSVVLDWSQPHGTGGAGG